MDKAPAEKLTTGKRASQGCLIGCGTIVVLLVILMVIGMAVDGGASDNASAVQAPAPLAKNDGEPAILTRIKEADSQIVEVEDFGAAIYVRADLGDSWKEADTITKTGMLADKIGRIVKQYSGPAKILNLQIMVPTIDRLGNEGNARLIFVGFPIGDLQRANFDNLSFPGTLNLASSVEPSPGIGRSAMLAWCETYVRQAPSFCRDEAPD